MMIPKRITPCPIAESIFEIRFESNLPDEAIFGVIYNNFKEDYPQLTRLPLLQLPETIRSKDPVLVHKPLYKLEKDNFLIQIGPKVFSLVNLKEYSGWDVFLQRITQVYKKLAETETVKSVTRIGLRYVNIFEKLDIYKNTNLKLSLREKPFIARQLDLSAEVQSENCASRIKMANGAKIDVQGKIVDGSAIDIDVVFSKPCPEFFKNIEGVAQELHSEEKMLFFSLLDEAFLKTLNPEY
jgi:uncharacterized protein (TIGR04255 family)